MWARLKKRWRRVLNVGMLSLLHLPLLPLRPCSPLPRAAASPAFLLAASLPQLTNGKAARVSYEGRPSSGGPTSQMPLCSAQPCTPRAATLSQSQNSPVLKKSCIAGRGLLLASSWLSPGGTAGARQGSETRFAGGKPGFQVRPPRQPDRHEGRPTQLHARVLLEGRRPG